MKKNIFLLCAFLMLTCSCAPQLIPPREQHRMTIIEAPPRMIFRAVKPALMKNGYEIIHRDITTGLVKAHKIGMNRHLVIRVRKKGPNASTVKINVIAKKNGRVLSVPEKTMLEVEAILNELKQLANMK